MCASPPLQLLPALAFVNGALLLLQLLIGVTPEGTLPDQPQCGLQQSQKRVA
jgi:hypothetical protein